MTLIALRDVSLSFRGPLVLDQANLALERGERVCLLGRNGMGKTTLLRLIQGEIEPQHGEIVRQQGLVTAMLPQEVPQNLSGTVFDEVARGLGSKAELLAEYHQIARQLATEGSDSLHARLDRVQHELEIAGGWSMHLEVDAILSRMTLDPDAQVAHLSAGMKRRVLLAKALVRNPDVLFLDEPTNHLDLTAIGWLEEFFARYSGTILFVTHDRALIRKAATRIIDVDRGRLTSWACGYDAYLQRKEAGIETETRQRAEFDKKLAKEEVWIRTGIQARRTRNEGRVRALEKLRNLRVARRDRPGDVRMSIQEAERSGRLVIEAKKVSFAYDDPSDPACGAAVPAAKAGETPAPQVIRDFSTTIMRGDRIGVIGPNGSGKTTLLRLLLGELTPQSGTVRHGTNLDVAFFDQLHAQLDDSKSVRDNVRDGAETVEINGLRRHIIGYLEDFLFTPEQAAQPVSRLSGGERNRLLLARLLTKPSNVLVMDEPTNDLDIETLELLENLLVEYPGTLLLVSHDREFLNNVVTSTLVLEGEGGVKEYAGGYDDWLRQRPPELIPDQSEPAKSSPKGTVPTATTQKSEQLPTKPRPRRLTFAEQRELESLPERIVVLEAEISELHQAMASPDHYRQNPSTIAQASARLQSLEEKLVEAYRRWENLEAQRASGK
jgi:ABC transport system ATP-binding/permease protein